MLFGDNFSVVCELTSGNVFQDFNAYTYLRLMGGGVVVTSLVFVSLPYTLGRRKVSSSLVGLLIDVSSDL